MKTVFGVLLTVVIVGAVSAGLAALTAWAWNTFMVAILGLPQISFWQAFALMILLNLVRGIFSGQSQKTKEE